MHKLIPLPSASAPQSSLHIRIYDRIVVTKYMIALLCLKSMIAQVIPMNYTDHAFEATGPHPAGTSRPSPISGRFQAGFEPHFRSISGLFEV